MLKNPFLAVRPWIADILHAIKKDIKADHLAVDRNFYKIHFGARPLNKLTLEEIFTVYEKELLDGNEELVEWAVNRWVFKHGDLYQRFANQLSLIHPEFYTIESLTEEQSERLIASLSDSSASEIYLFSRLNGVVFPESIFERLRIAAEKESEEAKAAEVRERDEESVIKELERLRRDASRFKEKYEDKLAGVQRKYQTDIEALKKQIRSLQQKLGNQA